MNILIINGSPRGRRSNSLCLANSFVEGVQEVLEGRGEEAHIDEVDMDFALIVFVNNLSTKYNNSGISCRLWSSTCLNSCLFRSYYS